MGEPGGRGGKWVEGVWEGGGERGGNHHGRMGGSGYPRGLSGEEISFASQIVAVADVFDAMTSDRGYNEVKTSEDAAEELVRLDTQFDPRITSVLQQLVTEGTLNKEERE